MQNVKESLDDFWAFGKKFQEGFLKKNSHLKHCFVTPGENSEELYNDRFWRNTHNNGGMRGRLRFGAEIAKAKRSNYAFQRYVWKNFDSWKNYIIVTFI